jgi:hypothetical protein
LEAVEALRGLLALGAGGDPSDALDALRVARATEQLRQEAAAFDQHAAQAKCWFRVRFAIGVMAPIALAVTCFAATFIIVDHSAFDVWAVRLAAGALLVDVLGIVGAVARIVLGKGPRELAPITSSDLEPLAPPDRART